MLNILFHSVRIHNQSDLSAQGSLPLARTSQTIDRFVGAAVSYGNKPLDICSTRWIIKQFKVFDTAAGKDVLSLRGHDTELIAVAYSPDGKRIVPADEDGKSLIWDATNGRLLAILHEASVNRGTCLAISPDSKQFVVGGQHVLQVWRLP